MLAIIEINCVEVRFFIRAPFAKANFVPIGDYVKCQTQAPCEPFIPVR